MGKILKMLNDEHYMGNATWHALHEWTTPTGEMGLYQETETEMGRENVYLMIWSMIEKTKKRQVYIYSYDVRSLNVAVIDAQIIARFAGATKLDIKEQ